MLTRTMSFGQAKSEIRKSKSEANQNAEARATPTRGLIRTWLFGIFDCHPLLALWSAFGEQHDAFEQIHRAVKLRIA